MSAAGHDARLDGVDLAIAFQNFEGSVCDVRNMTSLMETAIADTLEYTGGELAQSIEVASP